MTPSAAAAGRRACQGHRPDQVRRRCDAASDAACEAAALAAAARAHRTRRCVARASRIQACIWCSPARTSPRPTAFSRSAQDEHALAIDRVRFVGDPVAAVIARDELTAFEALDLIDVEYEPLATFNRPEESLATGEPRIHDYGSIGNVHKARVARIRRRRRRPGRGRPRLRGHLLLSGQHASADRAARGRRGDRSGRKAGAVVGHADAALRSPRACQGAPPAGRPHPCDRHAERRRLRRQERSLQSRDRGREGGAAARSTGEDLPDAGRGVLLPPRTASGPDAVHDRRETRRHDHRRSSEDAARRRRLRIVRRRQHVLHGRAADRDLPRAGVSLSGLPGVHEQAAVRAEARARHAAEPLRPGDSARQDCRGAGPRSRGAPPAHRRAAEPPDRQLPEDRDDWPRASASGASSRAPNWTSTHRKLPRGRGVGLACSAVSLRRRTADLLERHAAFRRAAEARSQRRRSRRSAARPKSARAPTMCWRRAWRRCWASIRSTSGPSPATPI